MSKHSHTEFNLEGRFLGFAAEEGYKLKLIRLSTSSGEFYIKLPKELRSSLYRTLVPGEWVQVSGYQKLNPSKGTVKLKAEHVVAITPQQSSLQPVSAGCGSASSTTLLGQLPTQLSGQPIATVPVKPSTQTKPSTILVCQKSDCCKRGATSLMKALQTELNDRGLAEQVKIRGTGCMKQCKAGPNLVMPDKSRYTRIHPDQVPALVDKHFPGTQEIAS